MKIYLVGGAVRDNLLGRGVKEHDYVVVGSTPDEMLSLGYKKVGKDFPVFLHPKTKQEYALARTERKTSQGYLGFECNFSKDITLEQDLKRRDLTINAMAMDEKGNVIDPYGGIDDLDNRVLRHVSDAFVEDPLRVLRVARFAARYHHLGFKIAPETLALMYEMVLLKELDYLTKERVWQEFQLSLAELNPEIFILTLRKCNALKVIMPEIDKLFGVPLKSDDILATDSGIRSLNALRNSAKLSQNPQVRFAALMHALPVVECNYSSWPIDFLVDNIFSLKPIEDLCARLKSPHVFKNIAVKVCELHFRIGQLFLLSAREIMDVFQKADAFRKPQFFDAILQAHSAIYDGVKYENEIIEHWLAILAQCSQISAEGLIEQGYRNDAIGRRIEELRIVCIENYLNKF